MFILFISLGEDEKQKRYEDEAKERWEAMNAVMWDEADGVWYDYDIKLSCQRKAFFPTNVIPLLLQSKGMPFVQIQQC